MASKQFKVSMIILCFALLSPLFQQWVIAGESMPRSFSLSVGLNGKKFSIGDALAIEYCIKNDSQAETTVVKWLGAPYPSSNLTFLDAEGRRLEVVKTAYYELAFPLPKEAFITLGPGEKHCLSFSGTIDFEKSEEVGEGQSPRRILRFENSYIVLEKSQAFQIVGKYEVNNASQIEWQKLYNFPHTWTGKLSSDPVEFTVTQQ